MRIFPTPRNSLTSTGQSRWWGIVNSSGGSPIVIVYGSWACSARAARSWFRSMCAIGLLSSGPGAAPSVTDPQPRTARSTAEDVAALHHPVRCLALQIPDPRAARAGTVDGPVTVLQPVRLVIVRTNPADDIPGAALPKA